jgi:hypothetical protein
MESSAPTLKQKVYRETKGFLVIALYLWAVLAICLLYKSVILKEHYFDIVAHGFALINALVLAKVLFVARALHLGDQFDDAPLIYPTLVKSGLFSLVLMSFKILEEVLVGLYHKQSFQRTIADLGGGTFKGILMLTLLLFVVLIPFFGFTELQRVLGAGKLRQLLFGPRMLMEQ